MVYSEWDVFRNHSIAKPGRNMNETPPRQRAVSRREFLGVASLGAVSLGVATADRKDAWAEEKKIQGFDETDPGDLQSKAWKAISDR